MKKYCYSSLLLAHEDAKSSIHPDDLQKIEHAFPSGWQLKCFEHCGFDGAYNILATNEICFRVKDAVIEEVEAPNFFYGDEVFVVRKNMNGKVLRVFWHYMKHEPYYVIECGGVESGYRYFNKDLERAKV
ncbi:hypothetical protein [Zooshikella ganghwensis]|uniref:hypothetical protein n=1 Tax=Zooshikella ganghwensis TaxID=202772 RepID=UPI0004165A5A|nr:hypothetical protein [Zooshikella ganghwensis]